MRKPSIVRVERKTIRMVRPSGLYTCRRYYVTLRFGDVEEKLAVSGKVVAWLRKKPARKVT